MLPDSSLSSTSTGRPAHACGPARLSSISWGSGPASTEEGYSFRMRVDTLEILRCPFCGTRLTIVENDALRRVDDRIESGVLGCECCAFPVVAGIPVLIASDTARRAMHLLEAGKGDEALHVLLALDGDRVERFRRFLADPDAMTYREGVKILSVDAEAEYFVYRFSDPTFRVGRAVVQVCGPLMAREGRYIDLCGGSGHLTRSMISNVAPVLADVMMRPTEPAGVVVMPHLHSSLGWNYTAGMPLTPTAYHDLLEPLHPRL